jgi:hypothetical protein
MFTLLRRFLLLFILSTVVLGLVAHQWPAPLGDPADPTDSTFVPKPEWWVLSLNQLVTMFTGPFSVIGTVLVPGGLAGLLVALPFIDRSPERIPPGACSAADRGGRLFVLAPVGGGILRALLSPPVEGGRRKHRAGISFRLEPDGNPPDPCEIRLGPGEAEFESQAQIDVFVRRPDRSTQRVCRNIARTLVRIGRRPDVQPQLPSRVYLVRHQGRSTPDAAPAGPAPADW